jgi:hypothetical protein
MIKPPARKMAGGFFLNDICFYHLCKAVKVIDESTSA